MKFIVVDNDVEIQKIVRKSILKETFNRDDIAILPFTKYNKELKEEINNLNEPKVYVINSNTNDKSCIKMTKEIRKKDWESPVIITADNEEVFKNSYKDFVQVFDFIVKNPDIDKVLEKDIHKILCKKFDNETFNYSNKKYTLNIYLKEITYIERDTSKRLLIIHTNNNEYFVTLSLKDIMKKLDNRFIQTHKSCIANKDKIVEYEWSKNYFKLNNKKTVYLLSKHFKKDILKIINN